MFHAPREAVGLRGLGRSIPRDGTQRATTESRKRNCETGVGSSRVEFIGLTNEANSQRNTEFIQQVEELTEERIMLREGVIEAKNKKQN